MRYLFFFLIFGFLLTVVFSCSLAQEVKAPETLEEAGNIVERIFWGFPDVLKKVWKEALIIWDRMLDWVRGNILPWLKGIWNKITGFLAKEVEERKPAVKEEFEKEKEEMKREIPKVSKSLWERFKELIR